VDHARPGVHHLAHLGGEVGEVGGQDRRGYVAFVQWHDWFQISRSIEAAQALHDRMAVLDIRTMVECSPQSGHSEHSSKRCKQYTQR
jgi:hypothetical protein